MRALSGTKGRLPEIGRPCRDAVVLEARAPFSRPVFELALLVNHDPTGKPAHCEIACGFLQSDYGSTPAHPHVRPAQSGTRKVTRDTPGALVVVNDEELTGIGEKSSNEPVMTTSTSKNRAVPFSPYRVFGEGRELVHPTLRNACGQVQRGNGKHCTSERIPSALSVRQTKRKSPLRWRRTMAYRRLTYWPVLGSPLHAKDVAFRRRGSCSGHAARQTKQAKGLVAFFDRLRAGSWRA